MSLHLVSALAAHTLFRSLHISAGGTADSIHAPGTEMQYSWCHRSYPRPNPHSGAESCPLHVGHCPSTNSALRRTDHVRCASVRNLSDQLRSTSDTDPTLSDQPRLCRTPSEPCRTMYEWRRTISAVGTQLTRTQTNILVRCICADIVGRALANGRVLTKHENMLDHTCRPTELQHTSQEYCGVPSKASNSYVDTA